MKLRNPVLVCMAFLLVAAAALAEEKDHMGGKGHMGGTSHGQLKFKDQPINEEFRRFAEPGGREDPVLGKVGANGGHGTHGRQPALLRHVPGASFADRRRRNGRRGRRRPEPVHDIVAGDGRPEGHLGGNVSSVSVQVWFAQDEISVRPGDSTSLSLAVENVGDHTESYTVIPAGLSAAWTTVTRPNITLFGGSRDVIEVVIRPPAIHTTTAGPTAVAVRVIPQGAPDDAVIAETIASVTAFDDRRVTALQPLQRGRRRATFEFMIENHGNNLASCRLHLIDPSDRVDGSFDPPAVGVAPGSASLVRLKLTAGRSFFRRSERQLDFEIEATEQDHSPATGHATLIQPPTVPAGTLLKTLAALAVFLAFIASCCARRMGTRGSIPLSPWSGGYQWRRWRRLATATYFI